MAGLSTNPSARVVWCVAVGAWSLVFAAPHVYWALGGRAGLGAQTAAADAALQQPWFAAYNVLAGCLGIAGAVVAYVLATSRGSRRARRWLGLAAGVGAVVVLLRGLLGLTLLAIGAAGAPGEPLPPPVLLAIEPWFVLGGVVLGGMALSHRDRRTDQNGA